MERSEKPYCGTCPFFELCGDETDPYRRSGDCFVDPLYVRTVWELRVGCRFHPKWKKLEVQDER